MREAEGFAHACCAPAAVTAAEDVDAEPKKSAGDKYDICARACVRTHNAGIRARAMNSTTGDLFAARILWHEDDG